MPEVDRPGPHAQPSSVFLNHPRCFTIFYLSSSTESPLPPASHPVTRPCLLSQCPAGVGHDRVCPSISPQTPPLLLGGCGVSPVVPTAESLSYPSSSLPRRPSRQDDRPLCGRLGRSRSVCDFPPKSRVGRLSSSETRGSPALDPGPPHIFDLRTGPGSSPPFTFAFEPRDLLLKPLKCGPVLTPNLAESSFAGEGCVSSSGCARHPLRASLDTGREVKYELTFVL